MSEEYLKAPREQNFYRYLANTVTLIGIGDQNWWGYVEPRWGMGPLFYYMVVVLRFIVTHIPFVPMLSQMAQMYLNWDSLSLEALSAILTTIPISAVVCVIVVSAQREDYVDLMKQFMDKIHLYNYRNGDQKIDQIMINLERYIRFASICTIALTFSVDMNWVVVPILYNNKYSLEIQNHTKELQSIIYFWLPFDYFYDYKAWAILHAINTFMAYLASSMIAVSKSLNYIFIFQWIGHINVLKYRIRMLSASEQGDGKELIDIIKYHIFIRRVLADIQAAFGFNITANYLHNLLGDSLLLYNVMFGEKEYNVTYALMACLYIGDLIILSFVLEEVRRQTEDLSDLAYSIPWQNMIIPNQKTFLIFYGRVQEPIEFVSAGGLRTGLRPMVSIIKSTFSYYVMLKSSMREVHE